MLIIMYVECSVHYATHSIVKILMDAQIRMYIYVCSLGENEEDFTVLNLNSVVVVQFMDCDNNNYVHTYTDKSYCI